MKLKSSFQLKWNAERTVARISSTDLLLSAKHLRTDFVQHFESLSSANFCWQYWHVPERYNHLRTPADHFFAQASWNNWLNVTGALARDYFGCAELSPPWLSYYVDGCFQNWHADVPHGPWAYVFSLTKNPAAFAGGRTQIMRASTLDYWTRLQDRPQETHAEQLFESVDPVFGQMLIFDPRLPHSVEQVRGVLDPLNSRVVIHGWLTAPRPFASGSLSLSSMLKLVDEPLQNWLSNNQEELVWHGSWVLKVNVDAAGHGRVTTVSANLVDLPSRCYVRPDKNKICREFIATLENVRFKKAKAGSVLTLPLNFSN